MGSDQLRLRAVKEEGFCAFAGTRLALYNSAWAVFNDHVKKRNV